MVTFIIRLKLALTLLLGFALLSLPAFAQSYGQVETRRDYKTEERRVERREYRGNTRYYYSNRGRGWYRRGWFGLGVAVPSLSTGVLVASLPETYTTVIVQGQTYYHGDNLYFKPLSAGGYTVVSTPPFK